MDLAELSLDKILSDAFDQLIYHISEGHPKWTFEFEEHNVLVSKRESQV